MLPDFNRLHLFYQVFRHKGIAPAAYDLCVTQSAVSQNLQKLEQELNILLFHRLHKKLVPTPAAERLFQSVMPFFATLDADLQAILSSEAGPQGLLRIGAPTVFGAEFLPAIIAAFRSKYPAVKFHLILGAQSIVARACRNGELDIALVDIFGNREEESWNLLQEPLLDEPLILVGSAKYIRRHLKSGPTFESISQCRFIAYQPMAPELTQWFLHHYKRSVKQPDIVLTVESVHAVISAIRSNLGLGIVPLYLVESAIRKKELEPIRVGKDEVKSRISLLRLAKRKPGMAEQLFIEFLKSKLTNKHP
jgi:DNA-binding transcriptional LysR family regulator